MRKIIIIIVMVIILVGGYTALTKKIIIPELVYGSSHCGTDCYTITTESSKEIPSTKVVVGSLDDDARLDTAFIVVYEQNKWFESDQKLIKLLKFQRAFTDEDYASNTAQDYDKLIAESVESVDHDHMIMTRVYEIHHKNDRTIDLLPESIITPAFSNPKDIKAWIANNNPEYLKLRPHTVVNLELLNQWKEEQYHPQLEYSVDSPEGLTFEGIVSFGEQKAAEEQAIEQKLQLIMSSPKLSSNPYDYIKEHQKDFDYLISQGNNILEYFLEEFSITEDNTLKEYIMAVVCIEILYDEEPAKTWSSGREWYEQYINNTQ